MRSNSESVTATCSLLAHEDDGWWWYAEKKGMQTSVVSFCVGFNMVRSPCTTFHALNAVYNGTNLHAAWLLIYRAPLVLTLVFVTYLPTSLSPLSPIVKCIPIWDNVVVSSADLTSPNPYTHYRPSSPCWMYPSSCWSIVVRFRYIRWVTLLVCWGWRSCSSFIRLLNYVLSCSRAGAISGSTNRPSKLPVFEACTWIFNIKPFQ